MEPPGYAQNVSSHSGDKTRWDSGTPIMYKQEGNRMIFGDQKVHTRVVQNHVQSAASPSVSVLVKVIYCLGAIPCEIAQDKVCCFNIFAEYLSPIGCNSSPHPYVLLLLMVTKLPISIFLCAFSHHNVITAAI